MTITDLLKETYSALKANKSRSALTILGIVIGIASVITMVSLGQGAAKHIKESIESLGSNLLVVMPGFQREPGSVVRGGLGSALSLTNDDVEAIKNQIQNIQEMAATVTSRTQVKTTKGTNTNTSVYGADGAYARVKNVEMESGNFLEEAQTKRLAKVAVLGPTTRDDLFGEGANPVGQKIRLENLTVTVIGVTESKGAAGFGSADDLIYIPLTTAQRYLTGSDSVSSINVQVTSEDLMTATQEQITSLLLRRHKIGDPLAADFTIVNQADIISTMSSVTRTMTLLLAAIGSISLLVGGIGIMNMMLVTVTERTREIGLRKSLGAKNKDISTQFLVESVALTFVGGFMGIVLGSLAAFLIARFSEAETVVTVFSVFLAFGVSAGVGIIFGFYPARRAAKLNPIEALRYE